MDRKDKVTKIFSEIQSVEGPDPLKKWNLVLRMLFCVIFILGFSQTGDTSLTMILYIIIASNEKIQS